MLTMLLALALNSAPAAHAEDAFVIAVYSHQMARAERHRRAEEWGKWLDAQDDVRRRALAGEFKRVNPFEADAKASPFAEEPTSQLRLLWWTMTEIRSERW